MSKILVVDDDNMLSSALADELTDNGFEAVQAFDGEEGLSKAQSEKPDLILLDLNMPKKNGFDVLAELKKDETTKNIPVIILTVSENEEQLEKTLAAGACDALIKSRLTLQNVAEHVKSKL